MKIYMLSSKSALLVLLLSLSFEILSQDDESIAKKSIANEPVMLTFGIVPQQAASTLARLWSPIFELLSQNANFQLRFATARDIPTFEKRLALGEYDIAYMNPYHYTVFHDSVGYQALVKQKDKQIKGIIVVRKDSPIQSLAELDGKLIAFPAPGAFAASVLPRANLKLEGIATKIKYVGSHDSVYLAVAQNLVDAGGGVKRTFNTMDASTSEQLRVLWETPGYTPHAVAVHPRVSSAIVNELKRRLVELTALPEGSRVLNKLRFNSFESAQDSDWDDVRALGLGTFSKPLESAVLEQVDAKSIGEN